MAYNTMIKIEWNGDNIKESHKEALNETAIATIKQQMDEGCNQGELSDNIFMDDDDLDDEGNEGIPYSGWWSVQNVDADYAKGYQDGLLAAKSKDVPRNSLVISKDVPRRTLTVLGFPMKSKPDGKKEIIRQIESLLISHGQSVANNEMDLGTSHSVKYNHLCYEFYPTYAAVEVYNDDSDDAIREYTMPYERMKVSLLKEVFADLQKFIENSKDID